MLTNDERMTNQTLRATLASCAVLALPICVYAAWLQYCEPWAGSDTTNCGSYPDCGGTCVKSVVLAGPATGGWCVDYGFYCSENATGSVTLADTPYDCFPKYGTCGCGGNQLGPTTISTPPIMCQ